VALKKPNIQALIDSDNLNNSIIDLDDYICALCGWGDSLTKLSFQQKAFYFNQELEREVNNGGFHQYFFNSSGNYANDTVQSLILIGAHKTAKILESANKIFPNHTVPTERNLRQEFLLQIGEKEEELLEELTQLFLKYEDDLNALNIEFVKANKKYF